MEFTTEFDDANQICIVRVVGTHKRPDDSIVLQQFARDFGKERGCLRFLFDMTQAQIISDTLAAFETGTVPADPDYTQTKQKIALVYSSDIEAHKFMEDVAVNRGYQVQVFGQFNAAVEWLTT